MLFQPLTKCLMHCDSTFDEAGNAARLYSLLLRNCGYRQGDLYVKVVAT
jgi:hypothetical protein